MERTQKYLLIYGLIGSVIAILIIAVLLLSWLMTKSLPETDGTASLSGISATTDVYRDPVGIPHILAQTEYDAYVALGYVHAQDRLWQMDLLRRYGAGRLSEVLGTETLPIDRMMRTVGLHRIADSLLLSVSEQTRRILEAYSTGVNACIVEHEGRYPVEFDLLQYDPEPWQPVHSLLLTRLMGWELALSWWVDLTLDRLVERFGIDTARAFFPTYASDAPVILPPNMTAADTRPRLLEDGLAAAQRLFGATGSAFGSNSWVVDSSHSTRGAPLLANDPHLLHMQPSRWYVVHLNAPGLNVGGISLPGVPAVVIGHNDRIGWGMTNIMTDDIDFFREDVSFRDSTYVIAGERFPLHVRTDSIFVQDSLPVALQIYETRNGPLISDVYPSRAALPAARRFSRIQPFSFRWTGQDRSDEILALYRLNHAGSWPEFTQALERFASPGQNFVYADVDGTIGYMAAGRIPIRAPGVSPQLPNDGSLHAEPWTGYVPYDRLPRSVNPAGGMLATANNKIVEDFPWHISTLWESEARILRIRHMLQEQPRFSAEDFQLLQMDVQSVYADTIRDAMVDALRRWTSRPVLMTQVMNRLLRWDCRMHVSSSEAALFNVAYTHLLRNTFEDEMDSALYRSYVFLSNVPTRVLPRLLHDTTTIVFDDVRTPRRETKEHILIRSLTDAVAELRRDLGPDINDWKWGDLHQVVFRHPLGRIAPLDRLFNVGPIAIGGNNTTVSTGEFSFSAPYDATVGASMRFIIDLGSPDSSYIILPTGQSGQPFSDHYADQTALWQSGAMHRLIINAQAIRRSGWPLLRLRPEQ